MFKKFNAKTDSHSRSNVKSSVQRGLRTRLLEQFPGLEENIDFVLPKKVQLIQVKCEDHVTLFCANNTVLFIQKYDDPLIPSIRLVHRYPEAFPSVQVDRGAIKFILSGANIMCPGLTSPGAKLPKTNIPAGNLVVIYAQGKENALAIGKLLLSTNEIASINKGIGIELLTYIGDGLWNFEL